jgi:hypothetical protein
MSLFKVSSQDTHDLELCWIAQRGGGGYISKQLLSDKAMGRRDKIFSAAITEQGCHV